MQFTLEPSFKNWKKELENTLKPYILTQRVIDEDLTDEEILEISNAKIREGLFSLLIRTIM